MLTVVVPGIVLLFVLGLLYQDFRLCNRRRIIPAWRNIHTGFICLIDKPGPPSCDWERCPHLDKR
jgi:hypothetical protein